MEANVFYEHGLLPVTQYSSLLVDIYKVTHPSNLPIPRPPEKTRFDKIIENEGGGSDMLPNCGQQIFKQHQYSVTDRLASMAMEGETFRGQGGNYDERMKADHGHQRTRHRVSSESSDEQVLLPRPSPVSYSSASLDEQFKLDTRTERLEWLQCLMGLCTIL